MNNLILSVIESTALYRSKQTNSAFPFGEGARRADEVPGRSRMLEGRMRFPAMAGYVQDDVWLPDGWFCVLHLDKYTKKQYNDARYEHAMMRNERDRSACISEPGAV